MRYDLIIATTAQILSTVSDKKRLGDKWAYRWVSRQEDARRYYTLCSKPIDYRRKEALTPELIYEYIKKLNAVLKKYDIQVVNI